ncbi:PHP domain-containing protein [Candidatus Microgenomates bacterium]|nr:PHP domain-containing protein [Candidatus Microgenomates bacterium]
MKKTAVGIWGILFFLIFSGAIYSSEMLPIWVHVHTCYSDGTNCPRKVKEIAQKLGYEAIIFTDHADCFLTDYASGHKDIRLANILPYPHEHPEVNSFGDYLEAVKRLNDSDFVAIAGREIVVAKVPAESYCHLNAISKTANLYLYDPAYREEDLEKVLAILQGEKSFTILNHLKDCRKWEDNLRLFDGFELMNDVSATGYVDNYDYHLRAFLSAQNKDSGPAAIGGADYHSKLAGSTFNLPTGESVATFVAATKSQESILAALSEHSTIATRGITQLEIDPAPSKIVSEVKEGKAKIFGRFKTRENSLLNPMSSLIIYKNGEKYEELDIIKNRNGWYDFSFTDREILRETTNYVLEIPYVMITSAFLLTGEMPRLPKAGEETPRTNGPVILKDEENKISSSGRIVARIVKASTEGQSYNFETADKVEERMSFYFLCRSELLLKKGSVIAGCRHPNMLMKDRSLLHFHPLPAEISGCSGSNDDLFAMSDPCDYKFTINTKSYVLEITPNDFFCFNNDTMSLGCYLATGDKDAIEIGDIFTICDQEGPLSFDSDGRITDCEKIGEAECTGKTKLGNCTMTTKGNATKIDQFNTKLKTHILMR